MLWVIQQQQQLEMMTMRFNEWFKWASKREVKLQKEQSQRVINAIRQEKLRFQTPKTNGKRASMS
jgi:hypothetical protein